MTNSTQDIKALQRQLVEIGKRIGKCFDAAETERLWNEHAVAKGRLGNLLLARDKTERPHIYSKGAGQ